MAFLKKHGITLLAVYIAFVFLQSLAFKGAELVGEPADITVYIFSTIGDWMASLGAVALGDVFSQYGGIVIGVAELVASILLLIPKTRVLGAVAAFGIISGAIFFHVFTPLGLFPYTDLSCLEAGCPREYALFFMAVGVWISSAIILMARRHELIAFLDTKTA